MINIVLVDDHQLFAEGIRSMFSDENDIQLVAHTDDGNEVPNILDTKHIDVIIMDIDMPIMSGIDCIAMLTKKGYKQPILVLTMHQSLRQVKVALEKGALGYILKDATKEELHEAITATSEGKKYFHSKINDQVFNYFSTRKSAQKKIEDLSEREIDIIKCLAEGMNTKTIAEALHISDHTVKTHRRNIMHKLRVNTSNEVIKLAYESGII